MQGMVATIGASRIVAKRTPVAHPPFEDDETLSARGMDARPVVPRGNDVPFFFQSICRSVNVFSSSASYDVSVMLSCRRWRNCVVAAVVPSLVEAHSAVSNSTAVIDMAVSRHTETFSPNPYPPQDDEDGADMRPQVLAAYPLDAGGTGPGTSAVGGGVSRFGSVGGSQAGSMRSEGSEVGLSSIGGSFMRSSAVGSVTSSNVAEGDVQRDGMKNLGEAAAGEAKKGAVDVVGVLVNGIWTQVDGEEQGGDSLGEAELNEIVALTLQETETMWIFERKSINVSVDAPDHEEAASANDRYRQYQKDNSGGGGCVEKGVQTFHLGRKTKITQFSSIEKVDTGVQATAWDLYDTMELTDNGTAIVPNSVSYAMGTTVSGGRFACLSPMGTASRGNSSHRKTAAMGTQRGGVGGVADSNFSESSRFSSRSESAIAFDESGVAFSPGMLSSFGDSGIGGSHIGSGSHQMMQRLDSSRWDALGSMLASSVGSNRESVFGGGSLFGGGGSTMGGGDTIRERQESGTADDASGTAKTRALRVAQRNLMLRELARVTDLPTPHCASRALLDIQPVRRQGVAIPI